MSSAVFTLRCLSLGPARTASSLGNPKQFRHSGNIGELSGLYFLHSPAPPRVVDIFLGQVVIWPTTKRHKCSKQQSVPVIQQLSDQSIAQDVGHLRFTSSFSCGFPTPKPMIYMGKPWFWFFVLQLFHVVWDNRLFRGSAIAKLERDKILRQNNFRLGFQSLMQCTFHCLYKVVIESGCVSSPYGHALQPVCACAFTWALKNANSEPFGRRKELGPCPIPPALQEECEWEVFLSWDFAEISSLRQGTSWPNQGQCQCEKCSGNGQSGSVGGRTKVMQI